MSDYSERKVLVTGASGQQGGAVLNTLLDRGHHVRALTRKPDSDWSAMARDRGVEIATGDFTNHESLVAAATGVDTVFLMTTMFEEGVDAETRQGLAMVAAAKEAGVGHLVYTSVANADLNTGIPHFDSKYAVESAIAESGIPYSILAPVFFMENITSPWYLPGIFDGAYAAAMPGDIALQHIAVENIGQVAVALIERRDAVFGKRYDIAGDDISGDEVAKLLAQKLGQDVGYAGYPPEALRESSEDMAIMYQWFIDSGYSVNIESLRTEFPEVPFIGVATWLSKQDIVQPETV